MSLEFILVQKAKSKGGDKYMSVEDPTFSIYVPQVLSRVGDQPHPKLKINISPVINTSVNKQVDECED
jgi:hypothetical protein